MPINLVYRGGSGSAVTIPDGTVIWDGEKYATYAGEELALGTLEASVTACNGRIEEMGTEMSTLSEDVSESLTMAKDHESRLAALEAIGIAEEGAY